MRLVLTSLSLGISCSIARFVPSLFAYEWTKHGTLSCNYRCTSAYGHVAISSYKLKNYSVLLNHEP